MVTLVSNPSFARALELLEHGKQEQAYGLIVDISAGPQRWLLEGAAIALSSPEKAKDMLSRAVSGLDGELRDKASIWLACCYWASGEHNEAQVVIDSVKPASNPVKFLWAFTKATLDMHLPGEDQPAKALATLQSVEQYQDEVNPLWRGKFHNERGIAFRKLKDPDRAIMAYIEARYWFEEAESPRFIAAVTANLAGILSDTKEFEEAHRVVDNAINSLSRLGDKVYLAQAHDQKAQVFLAQQKFTEASKTAPKAVAILENKEQKELLARSLITEAQSLTRTGNFLESFRLLDRAHKIGNYLNNHALIFDVIWEQRILAWEIEKASEYQLVTIALEEKSLRGAARKMQVTHPAMIKTMKKHGLSRTPKLPKKRILNARKK